MLKFGLNGCVNLESTHGFCSVFTEKIFAVLGWFFIMIGFSWPERGALKKEFGNSTRTY